MYIIATDILTDLCGLSLGLLLLMIPVGLMLWLFGWWGHRFWIVLTTTIMAGVFGLLEATAWKAQPMVVAVLLAIAAGVLALALMRVITFAIGGLACAYIAHYAFPALQQPAIVFLLSGLVCLLLFRWFFMVLTSFLGAALLTYGILALLNYFNAGNVITWSDENHVFVSLICGVTSLAGFGFQFLFDRWRIRRRRERNEGKENAVTMILAKIGFGGKAKRKAA